MENRKIFIMIITIIAVVTSVNAKTTIGITPATISFEDVLRGGYAQRPITITSNSEEPIQIEITPRGDITEWLSFSNETFSVSRNNPYYLDITVTPPTDIANGNYSGFLQVKSSSKNTQTKDNAATGIVIPVLDLYMNVEITDIEYKSCYAKNFRVTSIEEGDEVIFRAEVLNTGNVRFNPTFKIDIWDQTQTEVVESREINMKQIAPTTEEAAQIIIPSNNLERGQYWADITAIDCSASQTLTFDVLEEGSLRASGILDSINTRPIIDKLETTKIEAMFSNNGEKDVNAYFKGSISRGDRTIQLIETPTQSVEMGGQETFEFYFTPSKAGRYVVSGRVFYDNKRSFEKSVVITVRETGITWFQIFKYLLYTLLVAGIIYTSYKIRQEKQRYKKNLRRIHK